MNTFLRYTAFTAFVLLTVTSGVASHADQDGTPLWTDLDDIIQYAMPTVMPDAPLIQTAMQKDARFTANNAKFLSSLHFEVQPDLSNSDKVYQATAMMSDKTNRIFFRKFTIGVGGAPRQVQDVQVTKEIDLAQMHFQINAGLIDRMVILEDVADDIQFVFPLGVGGLDENVMGAGRRILTPLFHNAKIERKYVWAARSNPYYYRGQPFMPITNNAGVLTDIAFHITIMMDNNEWNTKGPNYLLRGFESHACMRLREKDLTVFHTIVTKSADLATPVNVDYYVWNKDASGNRTPAQGQVQQIHPYPVEQSSYMQVHNFGTPAKPIVERDSEHLVIMTRVNGMPDFSNLTGFTADDVTDLSIFDGLVTVLDNSTAQTSAKQ